ncbi:MAG: CGNR zinc finger domain-containing protein [Actinomycetia bacterium]|nr:CGNR zinc finger domain-containing protein [Actinomycetes bacterium]
MYSDPVDLVVAFLNTLDVEEQTVLLDNPSQWREWIATTLAVDPAAAPDPDRDSARALRTHLRAVVSGDAGPSSPRIPVSVDLDPTGAYLTSDTVVGTLAAAVAQLAIEKRWDRVKICPADDCRWAFYDASRNHSRQWCSMRVCGNRAKVRNHRARAD